MLLICSLNLRAVSVPVVLGYQVLGDYATQNARFPHTKKPCSLVKRLFITLRSNASERSEAKDCAGDQPALFAFLKDCAGD
jgi:hypothetical protein